MRLDLLFHRRVSNLGQPNPSERGLTPPRRRAWSFQLHHG